MNKNRALVTLTAAALFTLAASGAFATSKDYDLGSSSSVTALSSDPGLVLLTALAPSLPGTAFSLNDGQSFTFDFFTIWTNETTVNSDDKVAQTISATLNFVNPNTDPTINGTTVGVTQLFGIFQYGQVTWNGPVTVTIPGDRTFQVSLSDETFNFGLFGLSEGQGCGATVEATICQITSTNGVPETANTAMLLGAAVGAMVLVSRSRFGSSLQPARIHRGSKS